MDIVPDSMDDEPSSPMMDVVPDSIDDEPSSPIMDVVPDSMDDESINVVLDSTDEEPLMDVVSDSMDDDPPLPHIYVIPDSMDTEPSSSPLDVASDSTNNQPIPSMMFDKPSSVAVNVLPDDNIPTAQKREKRIRKQLNKPSTTLSLGPKGNLCNRNRERLWVLLNKLMRRRNWVDAGGVLAVLLQATPNERSLHENHLKYSGAMEILAHTESGNVYSKDVANIYKIWLQKNAPRKNRPLKDKFVLFDAIISFLVKKDYDGAQTAAICLRQDHEADSDPISNLIMGLCHYALWYTKLPKHRQLVDIHQQEKHDEREYNFVAKSRANNVDDTNSSFERFSETSVMNRKDNEDLERGTEKKQSQVKSMIANSDEITGSEGSSKKTNTGIPGSLLFPIRWDPLNENIEDVLKELCCDFDYHDAVGYLRKALNSTPGVVEALIPLVQILLLNDRVTEAFDELDKFSCVSNVLLASRLKTHVFECLGWNNFEQLCSSYEDILKKDPTCKHSIEKLIWSCQMGEYNPERLVEMIALHLDAAAFAEHGIWKEFASCLLKVFESQEDRASSCLNKEIPTMCTKGKHGDTWKVRCRWWKNRHFSKKLLASEMRGGELLVMTYKAACATQIYGPGVHYVVNVGAYLEEEDGSLFMILNKYVQSSSTK